MLRGELLVERLQEHVACGSACGSVSGLPKQTRTCASSEFFGAHQALTQKSRGPRQIVRRRNNRGEDWNEAMPRTTKNPASKAPNASKKSGTAAVPAPQASPDGGGCGNSREAQQAQRADIWQGVHDLAQAQHRHRTSALGALWAGRQKRHGRRAASNTQTPLCRVKSRFSGPFDLLSMVFPRLCTQHSQVFAAWDALACIPGCTAAVAFACCTKAPMDPKLLGGLAWKTTTKTVNNCVYLTCCKRGSALRTGDPAGLGRLRHDRWPGARPRSVSYSGRRAAMGGGR